MRLQFCKMTGYSSCSLSTSSTYQTFLTGCLATIFYNMFSPPTQEDVVEILSEILAVLLTECGALDCTTNSICTLEHPTWEMFGELKEGMKYLKERGSEFGFKKFVCSHQGNVAEVLSQVVLKITKFFIKGWNDLY